MGGGDLNLKKSWHPHTLKNQEKVWKAEQSKSQEDRKLKDLRREIEEEKSRDELKQVGRNSGILPQEDKKLEWMYKSSSELINREEYLLGRTIDKSFETLQTEEQRRDHNMVGVKQSINHVEHECIPFSIRAYRNMESTEQVDLQRKVMEDPLMLIKQREMESRKKILENPVKLKELHRILKTDALLKKSQKDKKTKMSKKSKKKRKKRSKSSTNEDTTDSESGSDTAKDLDKELAKRYKKLNKEEDFSGLNLSKLLDAKFETITKELDKAVESKRRKDHRNRSSSSDSDRNSNRRNRSWERGIKVRESYYDRNGKQQKYRRSRSKSSNDYRRQRPLLQQQRRSVTRSPAEPRKRQYSTSPSIEGDLDKVAGNSYNTKNSHASRPVSKDRSNKYKNRSSGEERRPRVQDYKKSERQQKHRSSCSISPKDHRGRRRLATRSPKESRTRKRSHTHSPPRRRRSRERNENKGDHAQFMESKTKNPKNKLSEAEKSARLREMMENASWREKDRVKSVQKHREANAREEEHYKTQDFDKEFINKEVKKAIANQSSVGSRIRSNLNNIQRTSAAMNSSFTKK